jgi:alkaline phosphatase D
LHFFDFQLSIGRCRDRVVNEKCMLNRRRFLSTTGVAASWLIAPALLRAAAPVSKWQSFPFTLGVASGTPSSNGFVIWTRLAPDPLCADPLTPGGMSAGDVPLNFEIGTDAAMRHIVQTGRAHAETRFAHSVHQQVRGLQPGRPYWYRFRSGDAQSAIGRAMTLPAPGASVDQLHMGFVSCANYEHGYFAAYRHLADEQPDLVLYLGDYIYEYLDKVSTDLVRTHSDGVEATDLRTYRNRYAQYRLDHDLQRLHATAPALVTWDDHEVFNDYGNLLSASFGEPTIFPDPAQFKLRRAAAYQAFYEHMPITPMRLPHDAQLRIYDQYSVGNLVQIFMTDARQYRSPAPCYGPPKNVPGRVITPDECPELFDDSRSMFGKTQEAWLYQGMAHSTARWNVIGQSVLMARMRRRNPAGEPLYWTDDWNGFPASRQRLLQHVHDSKLRNPVVLGGDVHAFFTNDLKLDFDDATAPVVATEFVGTSISSKAGFDYTAALPDNPHVHFFDGSVRGYVSMHLKKSQLVTRYQAISDPRDPQATLRTLKEFTVEDGQPGAQS